MPRDGVRSMIEPRPKLEKHRAEMSPHCSLGFLPRWRTKRRQSQVLPAGPVRVGADPALHAQRRRAGRGALRRGTAFAA